MERKRASSWREHLHYWGPPILWMGLLFYLSSRPALPRLEHPLWNTLVRKGGHAAVYALLAALDLRALARGRGPQRRHYPLAWALAVLYAGTDELHQGLVPGRHPTLTDLLIDALGATTGLALVAWWSRESAREAREAR